ncbi:DUF2171 domain-containing protein [Sphingomonas mucosissima]|uniref:DUF2171 domain-containing protein n=1 Tax=Sphingomonas mucosissima TaxID=370959 RepID=A0A245ZLJ3_9SPHN|nr:DUF2171 domain-containing protein [Sphingomonas mucosissima]OWK30614.1 hypothetical protein SPMU_16030 [Sphingomonas mucosissima]
MGYERYPRGDYSGRGDPQDFGRDYGSGRDYTYSSARDYRAAGAFDRSHDGNSDRENDRDYTGNFVPYGERGDSDRSYGSDNSRRPRGGERAWSGRDNDTRDWGERGSGGSGFGQSSGDRYGRSSYGSDDHRGGGYGSRAYGGESYGNGGGQRFDNGDRSRSQEFSGQRPRMGGNRMGNDRMGGGGNGQRGGYSGVPQGYDYDDRGFFARAGDEVRSWFGDDEAERRREADMRYDEGGYGDRNSHDRDSDYGSWRRSQIAALDRDYDEYRRENRSKFENEFSSWRTNRQTQRESLNQVKEHMDVVGADGTHVGTVDKVRGDRILLTKNDPEAEGHHHSIPSSWIASVDTNVTLSKTADEAKKHWRDEEGNPALFGYGDRTENRGGEKGDNQRRTNLNRSFSGTY